MDNTPKINAQKQKKIDTVNALTEKMQRAKAVVIADYTGIKHKQLEELRKALKKLQAEFTVTKNTLLKRVLSDNKQEVTNDALQTQTAVLMAYDDEASPVKALVNFFKTAAAGRVKGGLLNGSPLTEAQIEQLATLPNREILLAKLVGQMQAPIYGLHNALSWNLRKLVWTLDAVKSKK
ncbi:50S ribosomal protein L10 [Candidatus Microgenomates bacterium]|nr:MAG: 50S ribosomal protein L10 [Candidatus Microgenomates bacterium]